MRLVLNDTPVMDSCNAAESFKSKRSEEYCHSDLYAEI